MHDIKNIKIPITKLNIFYPTILGIGYLYYKYFRINKNYNFFNPEQELLKIVNNAINNIPYYQRLYKKPLFSIDEFNKKINFIDKDIVMDNWEEFILPGNYKNKVITGTTGGTSGRPMKFVLPKNRYIFELATMYTMWKNISWNGHIRAVIRNHRLKDGQSFTVNPLKKEIIFDGFRTSRKYYYKIYNTIKKHRIMFIHAYPSSAYQFSVFLYKEELDVDFIKAYLCGSEGVLPEQKELIENKLGIRVYNWYGHSEKLVLGGYCKWNDLFHMEPTYGFFELIDENGKPINEPGITGEIVGTTLHNKYMPLIRYRTGDYAEYAGNYCPQCGRHLPLLKKIYGRWDNNKIYRKDGTYITTTALNLHSDLYTKIFGLQYFQSKPGFLEVRVIKGDGFTDYDYRELLRHYEISFGDGNKVEIKFVDKLNKLPNGKFLNLISNIDNIN